MEHNNDCGVGAFFILGFAVGISVMVAIMVSSNRFRNNDKLIAECEKDLPRSQRCILVAIKEHKSVSYYRCNDTQRLCIEVKEPSNQQLSY